MKTGQVAQTFSVSPAWVRRLKQRRRETGRTTPQPMGGATVIKIDLVRLRQLVQEQPDATLEELRQRLGVDCHAWSVGLALRRLQLSRKKKRCTRRSRTGRTWPPPVSSGSKSNPPATPAG
jgi:transposase